MKRDKIDHLKYLDNEEHWLEEKIRVFTSLAKSYDAFIEVRTKLEEELDTLRVKVEVSQNGHILEEFVIISGVCMNKNISYLEKIIFRQSKGHSVTVFKTRERDPTTSVFLCLMNKSIYKHIGYFHS